MDHRCAIRKAEESAMDQQPSGREDYVRKVLEAYRNTPGTCGNLRRPDRILAVQLYQRGVPLHTVENALVLAAAICAGLTASWPSSSINAAFPCTQSRTHSCWLRFAA